MQRIACWMAGMYMWVNLPKKDLGHFRLEPYNKKVMFHSKDACSKNGLMTKKSDLEPNFFHVLVLRGMWGVGDIPLWRLWRLASPQCWMLSMHGESVSSYFALEEFSTFFLVPNVFPSNHHLVISHQKGGQSCCLPRSQKHYDSLTVPLYWLFRVGATCLPRTCGAALP